MLFFINAPLSLANNLIYNQEVDDPYLPLSYVINGTFDVAQNDNWFSQNDFFKKNHTVWRRVRSPVKNIKRDGGFYKFFKDEFLSDRVIPNILLHTVGGAYDGLWLEEYYHSHGIKHARFFAVLNSYFARFGNEILEDGNENITSHDHIADLFFFDPLGLILASNDKLMSFLVHDMGMRAWHSNAYYDPKDEDFFNAGLNYIFRPSALRLGNVTPFFYFGMQNIGGLSYHHNQEIFSLGTGIFLTDPLKQKLRVVSALFYEKENDLAFSAFINGSEDFRWRFNLYPKFFNFEKLRLGLLLGERRSENRQDVAFGLNVNLPFGLGR